MKKLHLVANAHIDPVWQWAWEEGASAGLSTFKSACDLAEQFDYIFCHNEVILYQWTERFCPELFKRIQKLAAIGKWHIMGGWYLQPDCNMPSGESFVRQAMTGRKYFVEKFGKTPTTAINFDSFGHSVGLVQILKKCGYDSYLHCRPLQHEFPGPDEYEWVGLDGSVIKCLRSSAWYNSPLGRINEKIDAFLEANKDKEVTLMLWGVGNHGGGPSKRDLELIETYRNRTDIEIVHSTPEAYFAERKESGVKIARSLRHSMPGCYSAMSAVKRRHRELENLLFFCEKICALAKLNGISEYPFDELGQAEEDLLTVQFHDILPGSSVREAEASALDILGHGMEVLKRIRAKALFALIEAERPVIGDEYAMVVFNPHPYEVEDMVECEFMLNDQNYKDEVTLIKAFCGDTEIPCQLIQENSSLNLDWRKRIAFKTKLKPLSYTRITCIPQSAVPKKGGPFRDPANVGGDYVFKNDRLDITVDGSTGGLSGVALDGRELLVGKTSFKLFETNQDPWAMGASQLKGLGEYCGLFRLMDAEEARRFCGHERQSAPIKVIEDGVLFTRIECLLTNGFSSITVVYTFPKSGADFDVRADVDFLEKDKILRFCLPVKDGELYGQTAFGFEELEKDGREFTFQKWLAERGAGFTFGVLNDGIYAGCCDDGEIQLTLLRSAAYCAHPIGERPLIPQDRYSGRLEQGRHTFEFRICAGGGAFENLERKAKLFNEKPYALSVCPQGNPKVKTPVKTVSLSGSRIDASCIKYSKSGGLIVRLVNCSDSAVCSELSVAGKTAKLSFGVFEVKTVKFESGVFTECALMEI